MKIWTVFDNLRAEYIGAYVNMKDAYEAKKDFLYETEHEEDDVIITEVELYT